LIWKIVTGNDPNGIVDHKNFNGRDNRWKNLRDVDDSQSVMNRRRFKNNTSGAVGIHRHKLHKNKWYAEIQVGRKRIFLGLFRDLEKAMAVRSAAQKLYHGEFAGHA
jgi:hypothetical protein